MNDRQVTSESSPSQEKTSSSISIPAELLQEIPEEKRADFIQYVSEISVSRRFSGPLPPPDLLNQYVPETQQTIVNEAVEHRRHRTNLERRGQVFFFVRDIIALLFAFILALILVVGSIDIIRSGQSAEGLLGIGGTVSLIVGAFIYKDHNTRKDRREHTTRQNPPAPPSSPQAE